MLIVGENKVKKYFLNLQNMFFINSRGIRGNVLQCPEKIKAKSVQRFTYVCRHTNEGIKEQENKYSINIHVCLLCASTVLSALCVLTLVNSLNNPVR